MSSSTKRSSSMSAAGRRGRRDGARARGAGGGAPGGAGEHGHRRDGRPRCALGWRGTPRAGGGLGGALRRAARRAGGLFDRGRRRRRRRERCWSSCSARKRTRWATCRCRRTRSARPTCRWSTSCARASPPSSRTAARTVSWRRSQADISLVCPTAGDQFDNAEARGAARHRPVGRPTRPRRRRRSGGDGGVPRSRRRSSRSWSPTRAAASSAPCRRRRRRSRRPAACRGLRRSVLRGRGARSPRGGRVMLTPIHDTSTSPELLNAESPDRSENLRAARARKRLADVLEQPAHQLDAGEEAALAGKARHTASDDPEERSTPSARTILSISGNVPPSATHRLQPRLRDVERDDHAPPMRPASPPATKTDGVPTSSGLDAAESHDAPSAIARVAAVEERVERHVAQQRARRTRCTGRRRLRRAARRRTPRPSSALFPPSLQPHLEHLHRADGGAVNMPVAPPSATSSPLKRTEARAASSRRSIPAPRWSCRRSQRCVVMRAAFSTTAEPSAG